jgi:hypothetical protein
LLYAVCFPFFTKGYEQPAPLVYIRQNDFTDKVKMHLNLLYGIRADVFPVVDNNMVDKFVYLSRDVVRKFFATICKTLPLR